MTKITVKDIEVNVVKINGEDYICLTDMLRAKDGDFFITDWLRNRNTLEFLGIWEKVYNPAFNYGEFAIIKSHSGLNSFKISVKEFVENKYFVEGSATLGDNLYILTWTNNVAFVYDMKSLSYKATRSYPRPGWGITSDGRQLIASDGSAVLYFMNPDLQVTRRVTVRLSGRPMRFLNELEYIDGKIWANVYTSDLILIINPDNGNVEATVDCSGLLPDSLRGPGTDVLNGIAYDDVTGRIYLTGKNWPRLYEVELEEK